MQVETFQTLASNSQSEFKDRGSKFLGYAFPISKVEDVKKHINALKELHPKAGHFCFAYRLGIDKNLYRASDDGEPSGSAGKPILGQIDSAEITNVLIVVLRYFGGTLLGVPGLINAYKTASQLAISDNTIITKDVTKAVKLEFDYTMMNEVMRIIKGCNCAIASQELTLFCTVKLDIPVKTYDTFIKKIQELRVVSVSE